jgi:hypothetical protein
LVSKIEFTTFALRQTVKIVTKKSGANLLSSRAVNREVNRKREQGIN